MTAQVVDTKESLSSKASQAVGGAKIISFADGTTEANIAADLYPLVYEGELTMMPWPWSTNMVPLSLVSGTPADIWSYAWQLPNDYISAQYATVAGEPIEYDIQGSLLYCNWNSGVVLTYTFKVAESALPPYFKLGLVARLAQFFATALDREDKFDKMGELAERMMARARLKGSQQTTNPRLQPRRLIRARLGGNSSTFSQNPA